MTSRLLNSASRRIFYPYWSRRDGGLRMPEFRRLYDSQWRDVAAEQKRAVVDFARYAYEHCEFYRRRGPAPVTFDDFLRIPVLTKDEIRRDGELMFSDLVRKENCVHNKTGGSTGVALNVYCDRDCQQKRNAAALLSDTWSGWKLGDVRGALWGNPPRPRGLKARARALLHDRLVYLDTVDMSSDRMDRFVRDIRRHGIRTLYGHSHSLFVFSNHVAARSVRHLPIRSIISTSMVLLPAERRRIEEVFQCRVNDRYGCEEVSLIASECDRHEGLHVNMDHIFLEVLRPDGTPAAPGEEGAVVVTEFINRGQPLLRYAVGDVAVRSARVCPCGRPRPLLERVVGRTADFLVRSDGSLVAGVSLVERTLTAIPGLAQMQIVQNRADALVINIVPDDDYVPKTAAMLTDEMKKVFGDRVSVDIRPAERLQQEQNGKYRFAICRVPTRYQEAAR